MMILKTTKNWIAAAAAMIVLIAGSQVRAQSIYKKKTSKDSKNVFRMGLGLELQGYNMIWQVIFL